MAPLQAEEIFFKCGLGTSFANDAQDTRPPKRVIRVEPREIKLSPRYGREFFI